MKKCMRCGNDFEPKKPKSIYCSGKCRTYAFRERKFVEKLQKITDTPEFKKHAQEIINKTTDGFEGIVEVLPTKPSPMEVMEIERQIEAIRAETVPDYISTGLGRAAWNNDQQKKIWALKMRLK